MTRSVPVLLLALSACHAPDSGESREDRPDESPPDTHESDPRDSRESPPETGGETAGETGDTGPAPGDFWAQLDWTHASALDVLLDLDLAPAEAHWEVRICVSTAWWGEGCDDYTTVAHSFSSLDLLHVEGGLAVMGMPDVPTLEELGVKGDIADAHMLTTPDLVHWGTHVIPVYERASQQLVDPALELLDDGQPRLLYYSMPDDCTTAPESCPGDHAIKQATWDGERFTEQTAPIYVDDGLVDPAACAWNGARHLFVTRNGEIEHATSPDGSSYAWDDGFHWIEAQVPHCNQAEAALMVVGQGGGGWPPPRYRIADGAGTFPEGDQQLWSDEENLSWFGGSCTSPVLALFEDQYVVICAVRVAG